MIQSLTQKPFNDRDAEGYLSIGELNLDYRFTTEVAPQAEDLATSENLHPERARRLWKLAARAYRYDGKEGDSNRCLVKAAECYVAMAASAGFKGMVAANWLMKAIKALRRLPATKDRRVELEKKLRVAQKHCRRDGRHFHSN